MLEKQERERERDKGEKGDKGQEMRLVSFGRARLQRRCARHTTETKSVWTAESARRGRRGRDTCRGEVTGGTRIFQKVGDERTSRDVLVCRAEAEDDTLVDCGVTVDTEDTRDDEVLPDSLDDCLNRSASASSDALDRGLGRMTVEVFVPELFDPLSGAMMANEGDQMKYWNMTKDYCQALYALTERKMRVVYPDAGVAAMLSSQFGKVNFEFSSLNDRIPFQEEDELIVIACADPQSVEEVISIARKVEGEIPVVLFNPRLASGDVGIGLAIRRLRSEFLSSFQIVYALRPFDGGAVFKQYPDLWKVFVADPTQSGRFKLISENVRRPGGEELANIIEDYLDGPKKQEGEEEGGGNILGELMKFIAELQKFARDLSKY